MLDKDGMTREEAFNKLAQGHELDDECKRIIANEWGFYKPCEDAISNRTNGQLIMKLANNYYVETRNACETVEIEIGGRTVEFDGKWWNSMASLKFPSVQPKAKTGKWIDTQRGIFGVIVKCNQCGNFLGLHAVNGGRGDANYCPNCGAKMEGGVEE